MLYKIGPRALAAELAGLHMDPKAIPILARKAQLEPFRVTGVRSPAANIIKQEMLAAGGDCATPMSAVACTEKYVDIILLGTRKHYGILLGKLAQMPYFGMPAVHDALAAALAAGVRTTRLADGRVLTYDHCLVMGILNVTPDSFFAGSRVGLSAGAEAALPDVVTRAREMLAAGADVLDVGGESTRPGAAPVTAEDEQARVVPAIRALRQAFPAAVISVDTYRASTAEKAVAAGADIINDVTALGDSDMLDVVVRTGAPVVLNHAPGGATAASQVAENAAQANENVVRDVVTWLDARAQQLRERGVGADKIILDPGIGFGKDTAQNLALLRNLEALTGSAYPVLLGASRKRFIGDVLGAAGEPLGAEERLEGSLAATARAVDAGCALVRVHDVRAHARLIKVLSAML